MLRHKLKTLIKRLIFISIVMLTCCSGTKQITPEKVHLGQKIDSVIIS
jgi:hypothetical protein